MPSDGHVTESYSALSLFLILFGWENVFLLNIVGPQTPFIKGYDLPYNCIRNIIIPLVTLMEIGAVCMINDRL